MRGWTHIQVCVCTDIHNSFTLCMHLYLCICVVFKWKKWLQGLSCLCITPNSWACSDLFYGHLLYWARAEPRWVDCLLTPVSTGLREKNWKKFLPEVMAKTISRDMNSVLTFHCSRQKLTSKQLSGWPQGYNPTWHTDSVGTSPAELTGTSAKVEKQRSNYCFPEVCWFPR